MKLSLIGFISILLSSSLFSKNIEDKFIGVWHVNSTSPIININNLPIVININNQTNYKEKSHMRTNGIMTLYYSKKTPENIISIYYLNGDGLWLIKDNKLYEKNNHINVSVNQEENMKILKKFNETNKLNISIEQLNNFALKVFQDNQYYPPADILELTKKHIKLKDGDRIYYLIK
jgi:hypothetical protein